MKRRNKEDKSSSVKRNNTLKNEEKTSPQKIVSSLDKKKVNNTKQGLTIIFLIISTMSAVLYRFYLKYGWNIILGHSWRDYKWTPYKWRSFIDDNNKTILIIGGPHRAGTTVIWNVITSHPNIVGFGDTKETGVDYSEGVLFQDVYPRFGVGLEYQLGNRKTQNAIGGLGQYALLPEEEVHWTRENKEALATNPSTFSRLLNRFAPYWDQNKKFPNKDGLTKAQIWVEKSPQNAVLSLFLEGVYNMPISARDTFAPETKSTRSATKFLFITRHPLANAYAQDSFIRNYMGSVVPFETLLKNYIQLMKYMKMDSEKLESDFMFLKLEDFASQPDQELKKIFSFLGMMNEAVEEDDDDDDDTVKEILRSYSIQMDPNQKYQDQWCSQGLKEHDSLVGKYNQDILDLELGYDLMSWCTHDLEHKVVSEE